MTLVTDPTLRFSSRAENYCRYRPLYQQHLDYEGVKGRLLSSSYTPEFGNPNHAPMLSELSKVFQAHATGERVTLEYITRMYYGRLS
jgi:hypothetical protein